MVVWPRKGVRRQFVSHTARSIKMIVVHHGAGNDKQTARAMKRFHTTPKPQGNGWSDIGYHRVIERDGFVMDGRPIQKTGSHAPPNANRLGICVTGWNGNEKHPAWAWSQEQKDSLVEELGYWLTRFPMAKICGHNQTKATDCPGLFLPDLLEQEAFPHMINVIRGKTK